MSWLAILFFAEVAFSPLSQEWNHGNPQLPFVIEREEVITTTGVRVLLLNEMLFMGANVTTYATPSEVQSQWYPSFSPFRDTYQFEAGLFFRGIEVGWLHECSHPVAPNHQQNTELGREWAYDRFYLSYEAKVNIF